MGLSPEISDAHENAAQLIPWLINGTLDTAEAASVRAHLASCPGCRADFDAEQRLYEAVRSDGLLVFSGEPSFQKLVARIEADDFAAREGASVPAEGASTATPPQSDAGRERVADRAPPAPAHRTASKRRSARRQLWRSPAAFRWVAAAAMIEALGLGLGAWAWQAGNPTGTFAQGPSTARSEAAPYRTLTTPAPSYANGPRVRVVFQPRLSLDRLQQLLRGVGAHIVDGPTDANVYTIGFARSVGSLEALQERITALRADPNVLFAEPAEVQPP